MRKVVLDKTLLGFIVLAVIVLIEVAFFFPLAMRKNALMNRKVTGVKNRVAAIKREWPHKDDFLNKNDQLRKEIEEIKNKLFLPYQRASILSYISAESEKFNIEIQSLRPSPLQDSKLSKVVKLKYLPVVMRARGKYHDLAVFLEHLQKDKYFFEVKKLDIISGYLDNSLDVILTGMVQDDDR